MYLADNWNTDRVKDSEVPEAWSTLHLGTSENFMVRHYSAQTSLPWTGSTISPFCQKGVNHMLQRYLGLCYKCWVLWPRSEPSLHETIPLDFMATSIIDSHIISGQQVSSGLLCPAGIPGTNSSLNTLWSNTSDCRPT